MRKKSKTKIDHIFVNLPKKTKLKLYSKIVLNDKYKGENLSDHYGVFTIFEFF